MLFIILGTVYASDIPGCRDGTSHHARDMTTSVQRGAGCSAPRTPDPSTVGHVRLIKHEHMVAGAQIVRSCQDASRLDMSQKADMVGNSMTSSDVLLKIQHMQHKKEGELV